MTASYRPLADIELAKLIGSLEHLGIREYLGEIAEDGIDSYDGAFFAHDGDLVIDGSFDTDDLDLTAWVIRGNLTVTGLLETRCNDGPTMVIVFGDLEVGDLLTAGFVEVTGDLRARESVVGDGSDGGLLVRGALEAELLMPFDHPFEIRGDVRAVEQIDWFKHTEPPTRLADRYVREVEGGVELITDEITADLRAGRSLLRQP